MKIIRIALGSLLTLLGIVFALLPGSIFLLIGGLMLLSVDVPLARRWLKYFQNQLSRSARLLDKWVLKRKYR